MRRLWPLAVPALALLAVLGGLLLGPTPAVHACSRAAPPTVRVPLSRAAEWERRVGVPAGPGHLEVPRFPSLPADAVVFSGTATAAGYEPFPDPHGGPAVFRRPVWTFTVEEVVQGDVAGPQATVVGSGSNCDRGYQLGVRQRVVGRRHPATGALQADWSVYADPATGAPLGLQPLGLHEPLPAPPEGAAPLVPPSPPPARAGRQQAAPRSGGERIAVAFLGMVGVLGLGLTAAGTYLRARELEAEREGRRRGSGPREE